jgi:tetratricopeptide (TPR) repeat protein
MPSIQQLERLLATDPRDPFVLYGLAQEHAKAGSVGEAASYYDRCLAADPSYCYAYYHKAKLLASVGRVEEARGVIEAGIAASKAAGDTHAREELLALAEEVQA